MAKNRNEPVEGFQDQGSLDAPQAPTGPVNPVLGQQDETQLSVNDKGRYPWEANPAIDPDDSSASALNQVNEAREDGQPFNQKDDSRPGDAQPAVTPAGTGVAAPGIADPGTTGTADTAGGTTL